MHTHCKHTADNHWCWVAQVVVVPQKLEGDHQQSSTCHLSTSIIFFTTLLQCAFYFIINDRKSYFHQSICFVTLKYRKVQLSAQCNTYMWLRMHRGRVSSPLPSGHWTLQVNWTFWVGENMNKALQWVMPWRMQQHGSTSTLSLCWNDSETGDQTISTAQW